MDMNRDESESGLIEEEGFLFCSATKSGREDENHELWRCPGTPAFTPPECCFGVTLYYNGSRLLAESKT
ncbi:hypothetical protein CCACVL1_16099 [Corchorus capsularis]|uniref:Uncharacterized protein n=1 Tax=Corchorus capsularis TaxID=210143 RepID=A0A1R3HZD0_COCAP|nr:hypothetical protein CCACVL1_16099 [Corchorus capsularis]